VHSLTSLIGSFSDICPCAAAIVNFARFFMIQRIQSIFLLAAAAALGGQFGLPYLTAAAGDPARQAPALADGALNPLDNIGLTGLTGLGVVVALGAIFLYNNRTLQARLAQLGGVTGIMLLTLAGVTAKTTFDALPAGANPQWYAGWAMPVLAIVCNFLAARAIRKDQALVDSMNRLR
jgi:uncharacterized membrane protein YkvI